MDKITILKMQRPGKKIVAIKPQAGNLICKNIFHQEGNKSDRKSYQAKLQTKGMFIKGQSNKRSVCECQVHKAC